MHNIEKGDYMELSPIGTGEFKIKKVAHDEYEGSIVFKDKRNQWRKFMAKRDRDTREIMSPKKDGGNW
jgi:hypothetical protein